MSNTALSHLVSVGPQAELQLQKQNVLEMVMQRSHHLFGAASVTLTGVRFVLHLDRVFPKLWLCRYLLFKAHFLSVNMSAYSYLFKYIIIGTCSLPSSPYPAEIPFLLCVIALGHTYVLR